MSPTFETAMPSANIIDAPGALAALATLLGNLGGNILEINHERAFARGALGMTQVEVTLETRGHDHIKEIVTGLETAGITVALE